MMIGRQRQGQDRSARRGFARRWSLLGSAALVCGLAGVMAIAALATPGDRTLPFVEGNAERGGTVYCETGTWSEVGRFKFTWVREGEVITGKEAEPGLQGQPGLTLSNPADEGRQIWCIVTGEGGAEKAEAESSNSVCFGSCGNEVEAPVAHEPFPLVSGKGELGGKLECSQGTWTGRPTPTLTYSWFREGHEIAGQTGASYTVGSEDEGHSLTCRVTAKNNAGEAFRESSNSVSVKGKLPENVKLPTVEGSASVGERVTCREGKWTGTTPMTYGYEWLLNGTVIPNAVGSTLPVESSYEGKRVACQVTATNSVGKATASSEAIKIGVKPPENLKLPTISGGKSEGSTLICSHGEWTGSPTTYKYQWYLRLEVGVEELLGETREKYVVVGNDVGHSLFCAVTAENSEFAKGTADSEAFSIPATGGEAPKEIALPEIAGSVPSLSCSEGEWTGTKPITYEYQWVRDVKTANEVDIAGASESHYMVQSADEGHTLTCEVRATNSFGSERAASRTESIAGRAPVETQAPKIVVPGGGSTGTPGVTLTCEPGDWEGSEPIEYTYSWLREGHEIAGQTGENYIVSKVDEGHSLTCKVTAKNSVSTKPSEARSQELYVPGGAPEVVKAPTITGEAAVGKELTCEEGEWHGALLTPSFEWLLDGTAISGATQKNYKVAPYDRGLQIECRVTETNSEGHAAADSAAVRVAGLSPRDVVVPSISGSPSLGATVTCEHGLWEGAPPPSFSYHWTREGSPIAGATEAKYTIGPEDQGHLLACVVTASNIEGSSEEETAVIAVAKRKVEEGTEVLHYTESTTPGHSKASVAAARDAFLSQLPHELAEAKLKTVRKSSSYSLGFTAAGAGEFELEWYVNLKAPHKHLRKVVVARGDKLTYTKEARLTMHLSLTKEGKRLLKNTRRIKLYAEATFKIAGGSTVTWSGTFTLH
jgi:hypothetical protein